MYYKIRKNGLLLFASMFIPHCLGAEGILAVEVNNPGKSEVLFALKDTPKYWVEGSTLKISSVNANAEVPLASIEKIYFKDGVISSFDDIDNDAVVCYPNPTTEGVYVRSVENQTVSLSDIQGRLLQSTPSIDGEYLYFDLSKLPQGCYFLKVNQQSFKIIKQ